MIIDRMIKFFNRLWEAESAKKWNECRVTLIHKGGHKGELNYISKALVNTIDNVFSVVLHERLCNWIE